MNGDTQDPRSTAELLCLLATYEAYGTGLAWSGLVRAELSQTFGWLGTAHGWTGPVRSVNFFKKYKFKILIFFIKY